ncbi:lactate utilization protein [Thermodesulfobacteriota bacterium]
MMNKEIETAINALKKNNFNVEYAEKAKDVTDIILKLIPKDASIELAGSTSVGQLRVMEKLDERGNRVPGFPEPGSTVRPELTPSVKNDVLLVSANAVTLDGKLVNLDGMGNRVTAMVYGTKQVILVVGQNKIVKDLPTALERVQQVIAPYHAINMGLKTPCTKTEKCEDCSSPGRICNITTIISKKPPSIDFTIIMVGEDMGLGWDPDWPEERIKEIRFTYRREWQRFMNRMGPPPPYKV